jgi:hypothetical protein
MQEADYFWLMEAIARRKAQLVQQGMSPAEAQRKAAEEYDMPEADPYE